MVDSTEIQTVRLMHANHESQMMKSILCVEYYL